VIFLNYFKGSTKVVSTEVVSTEVVSTKVVSTQAVSTITSVLSCAGAVDSPELQENKDKEIAKAKTIFLIIFIIYFYYILSGMIFV